MIIDLFKRIFAKVKNKHFLSRTDSMELRRSKRLEEFLAVSVIVRNHLNKTSELGPFTGRLINISRHGACVLLSPGVLESCERFRAACNGPHLSLELKGRFSKQEREFTLSGQPVWIDQFIVDDLRACTMGIEFDGETISHQPENDFPENTRSATGSRKS